MAIDGLHLCRALRTLLAATKLKLEHVLSLQVPAGIATS